MSWHSTPDDIRRKFLQVSLLSLAVVALLLCDIASLAAQERDSKWLATVFVSRGTGNDLQEVIVGNIDLEDSYFVSLALGREVADWRDTLLLEVEAQVVQHFDRQDHTELTLALYARWIDFPWNHFIRTSFAVGDGLSYATDVPEIEIERHDGKATRLLNYLVFELDFALPDYLELALVTRLHHRSGVFGLFDGVNGGSNFLTAGLRYRF